MTREDYLEYCKGLTGAYLDAPFDDGDIIAAKHGDTKKWFALIMRVGGKEAVNLKCEPAESDLLRTAYEGVTPAYHMNKTHWNTVYLQSDVPDEEIMNMTDRSFLLTAKKLAAAKTENK